jgi:uncharacterized membrane protein
LYILLLLYVGSGLLLALISLPLIFEKIKPNFYYGFRIRATLENEELWYAVNKYFAKRLLIVGVVQALAAIVLYRVPDISVDAYSLSTLGVFVIAFTIAMLQSWKYMKTYQ